MSITAYPPGSATVVGTPARQSFGTTGNDAGADGTLADIPAVNLQSYGAVESLAAGDTLDGVLQVGISTADISAYFYPVVFDDEGTPALKQNQALPVGVQSVNFFATGHAAP